MRCRSFTFPALFLAAALPNAAAAADSPPETLLAKDSVAYFRFDGLARHRAAYQKTVFGELLATEFQPLVEHVSKIIFDAVGPQVLSDRLLQGVPPAELIRLQTATRQLPRFFEGLKEHGFAVGVEVIEPLKGRFQVTIVFPGGLKSDAAPVLAAFRLAGHLAESKVDEVKVGTRTVLRIADNEPGPIHCWKEGPHAVLTIGSEPPQRTIELAEGNRANLTAGELFRKLSGFRGYETWMRGYADVAAIVQIAAKVFPPAKPLLSELGLAGLQEVSFHLGFDGKLQRSTVVIGTKGKRRGLLRLIAPPGELSLAKLPPLPPDTAVMTAGRADFSAICDEALRAIRLITAVVDPGSAAEFDKAVKDFEKRVGVNLRKDLIDALGSNYVIYGSATEGAFFTSTAVALEVKDAAKLKKTLDSLLRSVPSALGIDVGVKQRTYRGAELNVVQIGEQGFPFAPTFAIHKGWLVISFYPQPAQGFVYRSAAGTGRWQQPALLDRAIREALRPHGQGGKPRLTAVSVSNPKYAVRQVLSLAPLFMGFIRSVGEGLKEFDVSTIPNAQAVTERLTDGVSVTVDDGNAVRIETYTSLPFPAQLTGFDFTAVLLVAQYARFGF